MPSRKEILTRLAAAFRVAGARPKRRTRNIALALDSLEGRVVLSHFGGPSHHVSHHAAAQVSGTTTPTAATTSTTGTTTTTTTGTTSTGSTSTGGGCTGAGG